MIILTGIEDILHPMTVHFPIALILVSCLLAIIYLIRKHDIGMSDCIKTLVILGCLGAWAAVITGNYHMELTPEAEKIKNIHHSFAGWTAAIITCPAAIYLLSYFIKESLPNWLYWLAFILLGAATILIAVTGYFGGYIVYNVML